MKLKSAIMKDARDRKGLTQEELSAHVDISVPTIVRAENEGDINPSTGRTLCEFLGVNLAAAVLPRSTEEDGNAA
jgi:DNA-binding XRE family transcriptional regulator